MKHPIEQLTLIRDATELLSRHYETDIKIEKVASIKDGARAHTYRLHLSGTSVKVPPTLIAKRIKQGTTDTEKGFNDWGCLQFLSAARKTRVFAPSFIAGDKETSLYCIEDLGASIEIESVFMKSDVADQAFLESAKVSAQLAAATSLREAEFEHVLTDLPVPIIKKRYADSEAWRNGITKFREWLSVLNIAEREELPGEILKLVQSFEEPGTLLSFSHGDLAPTNIHLDPQSKRFHLVDFEYGAYRNALYDITAWNILCPLRDDLVASVRKIFRDEFTSKYEFTIEAKEIDRAWALMSLYRAIALFSWIPTSVIAEDKPWVGDWTCRLALLTAASRASKVSKELGADFATLDSTFTNLDARLKMLWAKNQS